jgi:Glu-tRNA(Gln) amidotransferase subunit E-like FAD-binding protein
LKEKFLRILIKVKQMQQNLFDEIGNFNYEKFWDGSERINIDEIFNKLSEAKKTKLREQEAIRRKGDLTTSDKAILVAVINQFRPQGEKVNRIIVSLKFSEIADKNSFKQFVDEIIELITEDEKLSDALFLNLNYGEINAKKKNAIKSCLNNIINESDDSQRNHQMQFLTKIVGEIMKTQQNNR